MGGGEIKLDLKGRSQFLHTSPPPSPEKTKNGVNITLICSMFATRNFDLDRLKHRFYWEKLLLDGRNTSLPLICPLPANANEL